MLRAASVLQVWRTEPLRNSSCLSPFHLLFLALKKPGGVLVCSRSLKLWFVILTASGWTGDCGPNLKYCRVIKPCLSSEMVLLWGDERICSIYCWGKCNINLDQLCLNNQSHYSGSHTDPNQDRITDSQRNECENLSLTSANVLWYLCALLQSNKLHAVTKPLRVMLIVTLRTLSCDPS